MARAATVRVFLDASGTALRDAFGAEPDFVKPNASEAGALLGEDIADEAGVIRCCARKVDPIEGHERRR